MVPFTFTRPRIMGIVNVTHDSFFADSRTERLDAAVERAARLVAEGAQLLDVGGESSRPGSDYVTAPTEIARVVPVVRELHAAFPHIPISVDTRKSAVAQAALDAGASMINDISALRDDPALADLVAQRRVPVVLMHMRGTPRTMQVDPRYDNVVEEVRAELSAFAAAAERRGVPRESIILDPGIGFGKRFEDNWALLRGIDRLRSLGYPLLIGLSRKAFLGALVAGSPKPPEERLFATLAAHMWCTMCNVEILRVHDVRPLVDALAVLRALAGAGDE